MTRQLPDVFVNLFYRSRNADTDNIADTGEILDRHGKAWTFNMVVCVPLTL